MSTKTKSFPLPARHRLRRSRNLGVAIAVVRRVQYDVRNWVQSVEEDYRQGPCPDIDPSDMTGACAIVSWCSQRILARLGIKASFIRGEFDGEYNCHCWLQVGGVIVDGTASQFFIPGEAGVYVTTAKRDPRYEEIVRDEDADQDLLDHWVSQSPYRFQPFLVAMEERTIAELAPRGRRRARV